MPNFMDEPTAGLDVVARETILDLLRSYMEQEGRGILISSHISSDLEGLCDDLYLIDDGKIALHEEMDVLLDQYGLLKMDEATWQSIDKSWILRWKKEPWGVSALTSEDPCAELSVCDVLCSIDGRLSDTWDDHV